MKKLTVRMNDKQHQEIALMAKRAGQSLNEFIVNKSAANDDKQAIISAVLTNQNRSFDALFIQLSDLKNTENASQNEPQNGLSRDEFNDVIRQLLGLLSIFFGIQKLDTLQAKTNSLQDKIAGKSY
jgi:uncharacterized protein (DUF1778 family)